jgi:hypothetical protein
MPNLNPFSHPEDPKERALRGILRDLVSQLTLKRIESDFELFNNITDAAANGGLLDDRQYIVSRLLRYNRDKILILNR